MTEAPSALPIVFTSVSGSGSAHAIRFSVPGVPLKRVAESSDINASFAISPVSADPRPARSTALAGSFQISTPFSISVAPILRAEPIVPPKAASNGDPPSSAGSLLPLRGWNGIAGGPRGAESVIDSITRTRAMPSA